MKRKLQQLCYGVLWCLVGSSAFAATNADSPVGYWTITEPDGPVIVKITQENNSLVGKIVKIPAKNQNAPCEKCKGAYFMKPITGAKILWGFTYQPKSHDWENGQLYAVRLDKAFDSDLKVLNGGQQLRVTAHAMFGDHEEVWTRANY